MRLLLVEDDTMIASGLIYALEGDGYETTLAGSVAEAGVYLEDQVFDIALLDLSLPDGTGYDVCEKIKKTSDMPVVFLTAVEDEGNIVKGLEMGAEDYITKPFRVKELLARLKVALRRTVAEQEKLTDEASSNNVLTLGDVRVELLPAKVYKDNEEVFLTALEYRLLVLLINHTGQVLSRNQLLQHIWDVDESFVNDNTVTVYMKRLREKLEQNPKEPVLLHTVRGIGYMAGMKNV